MKERYFDLLELPIEPANPTRLAEAYRKQRQAWFLRQYRPELADEARGRLRQIEEAYRVLRDPRRQAGLIRELAARRRPAAAPVTETVPLARATTVPLPKDAAPPAIRRPQIFRKLLISAEVIVKKQHRVLDAKQKQALVQAACRMGLDSRDATELVEHVARHAQPNRVSRSDSSASIAAIVPSSKIR